MEASSSGLEAANRKILDDLEKKFEKNDELVEKIKLIKDENKRSDVKGQVILKNLLGNILTDMENLDTESSKSRSSKIIAKFTGGPTKGKSSPNDNSEKVLEALGRVALKAKYLNEEARVKVDEPVKELIGREKEKEEIVDQLMLLSRSEDNGESPVPVIAISGLAGIGKTKLARHVYQDQKVQKQVGLPALVDAAEYNTFDAKAIAEKVIDSVVPVAAAVPSPSQKNLNILVILDGWRVDIEDKDVKALQEKIEGEDRIKEAQPRVRAIMITTRSCLVVRKIVASPVKSYDLARLNEKESALLLEKALGRVSGDNLSIAKIVGQCRGVPMAIETMAEWLRSPPSQEYLTPGEQLICSCYDKDNPYSIFAYFSLFPRDYLFDAERLIHLWMAEGFLDSREPEETGRGYLKDLVARSIFQDVKEDDFGQVRSFRMHPLMHDMARFAAKSEDITVDPNELKVHRELQRASFDLSLDFSRGIPPPLFDKAKSLRSIFFFANTQSRLPMQLNMSTLENIFKSFKSLRVLDLRDLGIVEVPSSIGDLELRYLDLSQNNMVKLPNNITKLSQLQTLKLFCCYSLTELPKEFGNLKQLKHLDLEGCLSLTRMPQQMSELTSLQTLSAFVANKNDPMGGLEELLKLNKLRGHLEIFYLDRVPKNDESKKNDKSKKNEGMNGVQDLTLRWDPKIGQGESKHHLLLDYLMSHFDLQVLILVGYGDPNLCSFKPNPETGTSQFNHLVKLSLQDCQCTYISEKDALPMQLKTLELIRLDNLEYVAKICNKDAGFYKTLMELTVWDCPKLKSWWQEEKAVSDRPVFASISKLHVHYCPDLTCMPLYPRLNSNSFGKELVLVDSSANLLLDKSSQGTDAGDSIPLENFRIQNCNHLENLCDAFKHLSSLQRLTIENCVDINLCSPSNQWDGLKSLRFLTISEIPTLSSLSFGNVTTLRELNLHNCEELTSISDGIGKLTSLRRLEISKCNKLKSLPKEMKNLKSLKTLLILNCNLLLSRCQRETGDDWPQIKHVEHIQVK